MQPWLIDQEYLRLPSWVPLVAIAAVLAVAVLRRHALAVGLSTRIAVDSGWVVFPAALMGARIGDVALANPGLVYYPEALIDPGGGYSLYGAALGGLAAAVVYARVRRVEAGHLLDGWALGGLLALPFARLGCLAVGCCYGRPITEPLGVAWPWSVTMAGGFHPLPGTPLHPVPLYEALVALALFTLLSRWRPAAPGRTALAVVMAYGAGRLGLDLLRADAARGVLIGSVSASQLVALASMIAALAAWKRTTG